MPSLQRSTASAGDCPVLSVLWASRRLRRSERKIDVAGLADGLPAVERLGHGELARALLDDAGDAEEVLRPFRGGELRPAVLVRAAGSGDREVDVFGEWIGCEVVRDPIYDPSGERIRA